jgi:hypothetical protein
MGSTPGNQGKRQRRGLFDFIGRILFFLWAPLMISGIFRVAPIYGAALNGVVVIVVLTLNETISRWSSSSWLIRVATRRHRELEAFYRENPPRPFWLYILFPVIFPYWLFSRRGRRELALFRGFGLLGFAILIGNSAYQYLAVWRPIPVQYYVGNIVGMLVIEVMLIFLVLMPVATTFVTYEMRGWNRRLWTLVVVGVLSIVLSVIGALRSDPPLTKVLRSRVQQRTLVAPGDAAAAMDAAIDAAVAARAKGLDHDAALARARSALRGFYRGREVLYFELHVSERGVTMIYAPRRWSKPAVWRARGPDGHPIDGLAVLSPQERALLGE